MYAAALGVLLLGAWKGIVAAGWVDPLILPPPEDVFHALIDNRSQLLSDLGTSALETILGLLTAVLCGALIALAMHRWRPARKTLLSYVIASQALPLPILAVPLILIFGFGLAPKVITVALVCFFPVTIALYYGLRAADPDQHKLLRSLGASKTQTLWLLEFRSALPTAFSGLRVAAAVSVIGSVFAEYAGSEKGLGHTVLVTQGNLETDRTFAATFLLFALALALYAICAMAERLTVTWIPRTDSP